MRGFLKSSRRWLQVGWFWPLVLLALPNCALDATGFDSGKKVAFDGGPEPRTNAIMCAIPKPLDPADDGCADASDLYGESAASAATLLATGQSSTFSLDYSTAATTACNGLPKKTEYFGSFPDGYAVCLNCGTQIPAVYPDSNAVCVAQCTDLIQFGEGPEPPGGAAAFCQANAHVATNFGVNTCFEDACSTGGTLKSDFFDPRRFPEPVVWDAASLIGTERTGNDLKRTADTTGPSAENFDAGAASEQEFKTGDGWVEFEAGETNLSHVIGVSANAGGTDLNPGLSDIGFAISLNSDGMIYIVENGNLAGGPFGAYVVGQRFRVRVKDNNDGTASITYTKLTAPCDPGKVCNFEETIATQIAASPSYPLRVDASFREKDAILKNVMLVRIKP